MRIVSGLAGALFLTACGQPQPAAEQSDTAPGAPQTATAQRPPAFQQCVVCHADTPGAPRRSGPNLHGVMGTQAGTVPADFAFSDSMKKAGFTWDRAKMDAFIEHPAVVVPGTRMVFRGEKDPARRKAIVDYLETLK